MLWHQLIAIPWAHLSPVMERPRYSNPSFVVSIAVLNGSIILRL